MGSPLEQAPYASMMSRELGAIVLSVSYRIGPFHQFPAAIHDAEDVLSAILDTSGTSEAGKVLRQEVQRYYSMVRTNVLEGKNKNEPVLQHIEQVTDIVLDPTHLAISGFSAGGNIALNMAISVPPCPQMGMMESQTLGPADHDCMSPTLPVMAVAPPTARSATTTAPTATLLPISRCTAAAPRTPQEAHAECTQTRRPPR